MSLADVITRFSTAEADGVPAGYVVTRTVQGSRNSSGVYTPGGTTTLNIDACIQPYRGRGLKVNPEGRNTSDLITIDTVTPLFTETPANKPDSINYRGEAYMIVQVDGPMTLNNVSTYRAYGSRSVVP